MSPVWPLSLQLIFDGSRIVWHHSWSTWEGTLCCRQACKALFNLWVPSVTVYIVDSDQDVVLLSFCLPSSNFTSITISWTGCSQDCRQDQIESWKSTATQPRSEGLDSIVRTWASQYRQTVSGHQYQNQTVPRYGYVLIYLCTLISLMNSSRCIISCVVCIIVKMINIDPEMNASRPLFPCLTWGRDHVGFLLFDLWSSILKEITSDFFQADLDWRLTCHCPSSVL